MIVEFISKHKIGVVVGAVALVIVAIVAMVFYSKVNGLRNTAISKETALVSQYKDNQNELSTYILQFKETMGVANVGADRLEDILVDAVKGRYDGNMEPGDSGSMFSAIAEAYPDLTATSESYAKVQDLVVSGRNAYKNQQTKLLDMIRDYDSWRNRDFIDSLIVRDWIGAPTDLLKVNVAGVTYKGEDALEKISEIVLVQDAIDSYDTGIQEPLIGDEETE